VGNVQTSNVLKINVKIVDRLVSTCLSELHRGRFHITPSQSVASPPIVIALLLHSVQVDCSSSDYHPSLQFSCCSQIPDATHCSHPSQSNWAKHSLHLALGSSIQVARPGADPDETAKGGCVQAPRLAKHRLHPDDTTVSQFGSSTQETKCRHASMPRFKSLEALLWHRTRGSPFLAWDHRQIKRRPHPPGSQSTRDIISSFVRTRKVRTSSWPRKPLHQDLSQSFTQN
jgi:hypothetical protein